MSEKLREQFEKETGENYLENNIAEINPAYLEWLEAKAGQHETIVSLIDEAIEKNESLSSTEIALTSKYYAREILNEFKSKISN